MHSILKTCDNCEDMKTLYSRIECSILYMIKQKHAIQIYNLEDNFNEDRFKNLLRYKRIVGKRLWDSTYPNNIKTSSLIQKVSQLAFKDENCSVCEECYPDL